MSLRLKNFLAACLLVLLACAVYRASPFNQQQLANLFGPRAIAFRGDHFLMAAAAIYIGLLALYYGSERAPRESKSLCACRCLLALVRAPRSSLQAGLSPAQRLALLTTLLKGFFGPLMVMSLMDFSMGALVALLALLAAGPVGIGGFQALFDRAGFWLLMHLILFVDVLIFTVGYLVESPRLGNEIRSVETTLIGWVAALACYPPFNQLTVTVLGSYRSDFPKFENGTVHLAMNLLLLALMATYAAASVALGMKASNLTYRGLVRRGPYALVRHPAYTCKNLAWWIGSVPLVAAAFDSSWLSGVQAVGSMLAWSLIYVLRALTEEDHLRRIDGAYDRYAQQVRWRFVPGVI